MRKFISEFFKVFVKYLLDGYIITVSKPRNIKFYIGKLKKVKINDEKKKYICLHTNGDIYGIKLKGVDIGDYHFKLALKYRQDLAKRILDGQEYYN